MKTNPVLFAAVLSLLLTLPSFSSRAEADRPVDPRVLADAIAKEPNSHPIRIIAGFQSFNQGNFEIAETHFRKASQLTPDDPYDQAWLFMTQLRRDKRAPDKEIRAFLARKRSEEFVYIDILILLSEITPEAAVEKAKASRDLGNLCEAHYFAAQHFLANGQVMEAKAHLQQALQTKKETFWEYKSAAACLRSLSP